MTAPKEKKATSDKDKTRAQLLEEVDLLRQQLADRETAKGHREHSYTHAPVGLCYFDRDMRYLQINDCLAAINGLSVEEHLGKRIQDVLPQGAVGIVHRLRQVIETGEPIIEESAYIETAAHPGEKHLYEYSCYPSKSENGTIRGVSCLVRDLTDSKKTRSDEIRFHEVVEHATDGIMMMSEDGIISYFNCAAEKMFGYARDEVIGMPMTILMPKPYRKQHEAGLRRNVSTGQSTVLGTILPLEGLHKNGTVFPIELTVSMCRIDGRRVFTGILRDLTEKKKIEERLHQSHKLEALGALAGGVAHDFNNLLMSIIGYAALVRDDLPSGDKRKDNICEVLTAANRAAGLTRQLLTFSHRTPTDLQNIDICDFLKGIESLLQRTIGEDIHLRMTVPSQSLCVRANPAQLNQIVLNLLVNARDAMPHGGSLKITASVADIESSAEPESPVAGRYIRIDVVDSGVGMDDTTRAHIFEPFFTTKGAAGGTGFGLATCYGAVKQLGGTIQVDSNVGNGTTFTLHLPLYTGTAEPDSPRSVDRTDLIGDETILIIEDEGAIRHLAERTLRQYGYSVLIADDGIHGMKLFEANKEIISLVFSDIVLPRGNGFDVAQEVRRQRPDVAILLTSGYTDRRIERESDEFPVFWKPYTPEEMVRRIRASLNDRALAVGIDVAGATVLIVDDDEQVLGMLRAMLEQIGCRVFEAADGNEGLKHLRETACDVVITDLVMPGKEGTEVCMEIKREFPQTKVIAISGAPQAVGYLSVAHKLGATSTLHKPFTKDDLLLALSHTLK